MSQVVSRSYIALIYSCLTFSNPFYFMEDILYGTNDPKKDFGIYEIAIGPGSHDFASWHIEVVDLFRTQDWASSLLDYSTVLDEDFPFLIIEKDKFEDFKSEVKKIKRTEKDWFKDLDFLYLDASVYIESAPENSKFIAIIYSEPIITGDMIDQAYVSSDEKINTSYRVNLEMNDVGSEKWKTFTGNNINKFAPIIMDNEIISMPRINSEIPNGECYIDGFANIKEANYLATQLKFGKFNLALKKVYDKTVDASLGNQMITLGIYAFIIGISLVIVFMTIYYKTSGLIASTSLILNILFMSSILSMLGATLTLPGIAGFILTVGIAVDANVIIFERIKEEIRTGMPPLSAIESGYDRAFISIIDANVTTLLTAIILYLFGSGPIKGFAITLSAGIVCSMFTAIYITRTIFNTIYYSKVPKKLSI